MASQSPGGEGLGTTNLTQIIEPGIIVAASVYTDDDNEQEYQTWANIHICRGGTKRSNRIHQLDAGYVSEQNPLTWHGLFLLHPDDAIRVVLRGNLDPVFRVQFARLTPATAELARGVIDAITSTT